MVAFYNYVQEFVGPEPRQRPSPHMWRLAEDAWNTRDPERVSLAYTLDSQWRNRSEFISGREQIVSFLQRKWNKELDYRLIKELWIAVGNRIAVAE